MLKLPFIEKTYVGIEVTSENLVWLELNKIGNRIEVLSYGELHLNESLEGALLELNSQLVNDAYYMGVADKRILKQQSFIEAPFFEEEEDYEQWRINLVNKTSLSDLPIIISSHIISLNEYEKRVHLQENQRQVIKEIIYNCEQNEFPLAYLSNGFIEQSYSQVLNPEFVDSYSGVVAEYIEGYVLLLFNQGRVVNSYELVHSHDPLAILLSADAILTSEEHLLEIADQSIPCFHSFELGNQTKNSRKFLTLEPYFNKGKKRLPVKFSVAAGIVLKMCYPGLDQIELLSYSEKENAHFKHDKLELLRMAVILFAPLIVFLFIAFGVEKWNEPTLNEVAQISELVGGKLELVTTEKDIVLELKNEFERRRAEYGSPHYTAPLFELIASSIPEDVWLNEFSIVVSENKIITELEGLSKHSEWITKFIQKIQESDAGNEVRLLSSLKAQADVADQNWILFSLHIETLK